MKSQEIRVKIKHPKEVLGYTKCPNCKKDLDNTWTCKHCKTQLLFDICETTEYGN